MDYDLTQARTYLQTLSGQDDPRVTWCVIREKGSDSIARTAHYYGTLEQYIENGILDWAQKNRAGVYVLVNEGDGSTRRTADTIVRCRAVWCERDDHYIPDWPLEPSIVVRTPGGHHFYWRTDNLPLLACRGLNERIIYHYGGDGNAKDVCRVLRVPGFYHQKNNGQPRLIKLVSYSDDVYDARELQKAFPDYKAPKPSIPDDVKEHWGKAPNQLDELDPMVRRVLQQRVDKLADTPAGQDGGRNGALNLTAFLLAQIGPSHLGEDLARELCHEACQENGLIEEYGETSFRKTFMSGWRSGAKDPRGIPSVDAEGNPMGRLRQGVNHQDSQPPIGGAAELHIMNSKKSLLSYFADIAAKDLSPIPLPLESANQLLNGGILPGAMTLLTAAPGHSKSTLALRVLLDEALRGLPVFFVSLEMPLHQTIARLVSIIHDVNWSDVELGKHNDLVAKTFDSLSDKPFYIVDYNKCSTTMEIDRCIKLIYDEHRQAPFTTVDYIQLLAAPDKRGDFRVSSYECSLSLSRTCKAYDVPMLCISSVGRGCYDIIDKRTNEPSASKVLGSAKESGQFEFDAKTVIGLQLYEPQTLTSPQYGWMCIAKNRAGGSVGSVPFCYHGQDGEYEEVSRAELVEAVKPESNGNRCDIESPREAIIKAIRENEGLKSFSDVARASRRRKSTTLKVMKKLFDEGVVSLKVDNSYQVHEIQNGKDL